LPAVAVVAVELAAVVALEVTFVPFQESNRAALQVP
jgi:hypothetical protein